MNIPPRLAAMVAIALMATVSASAQPPKPLDFEVKATYLLNFGRFATWPTDMPSSERGRFPVCVIGRDPFGPTLDQTVAGETIDGQGVVSRRIASVQEAASCRILFVSDSEETRLAAILRVAETAGVLTVSDIPRFTERGGMIQFVSQDRRVRFQVNDAAVQSAGLSLSSQLLRVATSVSRGKP